MWIFRRFPSFDGEPDMYHTNIRHRPRPAITPHLLTRNCLAVMAFVAFAGLPLPPLVSLPEPRPQPLSMTISADVTPRPLVPTPVPPSSCNVVVIGAGMSGITAAAILKKIGTCVE